MSNEEVKLFGILITSVIAIIGGVVGWFGKIYLDSRIEKLKKSHALDIANIQGQISADIELQKTRLKNSEIFFQQQLTALKELNKLRQEILPDYRMPDMEWDDACQDIAYNFYKIEKSIESYINEYYSVLPEEIVSKINSAKNSSAEGKFEEPEDLKSYQLADNLWKRIDEATNELKKYVEAQMHNKSEETNQKPAAAF